jgi:aryl-alcohol dehydrogenase-like predicted oxidoreductase
MSPDPRRGTILALGTAQFGSPYGIANRTGQVAPEEIRAILRHAETAGIDLLDTAIAYGDSEGRLGAAGIAGWAVVSKLPAVPDTCAEADVERWVHSMVEASIRRLGVPRLYGVLLHRPAQLLSARGPSIYRALSRVRDAGLTERIGASTYSPSEAVELGMRFPFDIVQAPLNPFDRRLVEEGVVASLTARGVEVHARSVFLQGLLLLPPGHRPPAFARWRPIWDRWDAWLAEAGLRPIEACLRFVCAQAGLRRVVVGVDTLAHLRDILQSIEGDVPDLPSDLACDDQALVNPACWVAS